MPVKEKYAMTDRAIAREVGLRIDQIRLEQNISQKEIAENVGITVKTYRNLIDGGGKFETLIAVLRLLNQLDLVESFVPETTFSPLELMKLRGKKRQRASGNRKPDGIVTPHEELDW